LLITLTNVTECEPILKILSRLQCVVRNREIVSQSQEISLFLSPGGGIFWGEGTSPAQTQHGLFSTDNGRNREIGGPHNVSVIVAIHLGIILRQCCVPLFIAYRINEKYAGRL